MQPEDLLEDREADPLSLAFLVLAPDPEEEVQEGPFRVDVGVEDGEPFLPRLFVEGLERVEPPDPDVHVVPFPSSLGTTLPGSSWPLGTSSPAASLMSAARERTSSLSLVASCGCGVTSRRGI